MTPDENKAGSLPTARWLRQRARRFPLQSRADAQMHAELALTAVAIGDLIAAADIWRHASRLISHLPADQRAPLRAALTPAEVAIRTRTPGGRLPEAAKGPRRRATTPARNTAGTTAAETKDGRKRHCADCGRSAATKSLTNASGRWRCHRCHEKWAYPRCAKCGLNFKRPKSSPRQRNCGACGGGQSPTGPRTVSAGLPGLGRRR